MTPVGLRNATEMKPSLSVLLRRFYALTVVNTLDIPVGVSFQDFNYFLVELLEDPHFREYAPSTQYQQQFWKWAIQQLEEMARDTTHEGPSPMLLNIRVLMPRLGVR